MKYTYIPHFPQQTITKNKMCLFSIFSRNLMDDTKKIGFPHIVTVLLVLVVRKCQIVPLLHTNHKSEIATKFHHRFRTNVRSTSLSISLAFWSFCMLESVLLPYFLSRHTHKMFLLFFFSNFYANFGRFFCCTM